MSDRRWLKAHWWCALVLLGAAAFPVQSQLSGEVVRLEQEAVQDVYAAGGVVEVLARARGDVIVAGGRVSIGEVVDGDVVGVAGTIGVYADIGDDARLAGGDITLSSTLHDDFIAAGGNISITPKARVNGRAWLAGGRVDIAGEIGEELRVAAGKVVLSGRVKGDVWISSQDIEVRQTAIIDGNLNYRGPRPAVIHNGATIIGETVFEEVKRPVLALVAWAVAIGVVVALSLMLTGAGFYFLFPTLIETSLDLIGTQTWKCAGLGMSVIAAVPVVNSLLAMTIIGWLPALVVATAYTLVLLFGFFVGMFCAGQLGTGGLSRRGMTRSSRIRSFVGALPVVLLLGVIPIVGTLLLFTVLVMGVGSLTLSLYRAYSA